MISIIPSLDFMRNLCGTYNAANGQAELRVWACGYGVSIDLRSEKKTELVGVVGASGNAVECFAQVGLPNVVRLIGRKASDASIQFDGDDFPLSIILLREPGAVCFTLTLHGQEKISHVLEAAV